MMLNPMKWSKNTFTSRITITQKREDKQGSMARYEEKKKAN